MRNYFFILLIILGTAHLRGADNQTTGANSPPIQDDESVPEIPGAATAGLQPNIMIWKDGENWVFIIEYVAQTNFTRQAWLQITNRAGAKLELWLSDGQKAQIKDPATLAAMKLPAQTTVSNLMKSVRHPRARQWLPFSSAPPQSGSLGIGPTFDLRQAFGISFTNNVELQMTPLLYRVDSNVQTARLVEFPPIKMKLLSNGEVKKE